MKRKYLIISIIITLSIFFLTNFYLINKTYAYQYNFEDTNLFYEKDKEVLKNNIKQFIEYMDDLLIPCTSFDDSNTLIYNYDFLTHFSLNYTISNKDYYQKQIKKLNTIFYQTKEGEILSTDEYIPISTIYEITFKYFNINYFEMTTDDIKIIDNNIALTDYTTQKFNSKITNLEIKENKNIIKAYTSYNTKDKYIYTLENINDVLKIKNIEVMS